MPVTDVEWFDEDILRLESYYKDLMRCYIEMLNDDTLTRNISIKNTDEILTNVLEPEIDDPIMCPIFSDKWCAFDTNGDIYPCHQGPTSEEKFKKDLYLGNLYTGVDETKLKLEDTHASYPKEECKDCIGKSICKGGCPTQNLRETGVYDVPSDGHCKTSIALVKAVLKYREELMNASNIRNRMINILKENLKLKEYTDILYNETDLNDDLILSTRIMHLKEMVNNLGEKNLLPTFKQYIDSKISLILAYQLSKHGVSLNEMAKKLEEEEKNG
jgi:radical SAM protein with 4Fe4S-binding SPASM domain